MYLKIDNIIGEKTIYLQYPIENLDNSKRIAIVEIFMDNVTYKIDAKFEATLEVGGIKVNKIISQGTYTSRELSAFLSGNVDPTPLSNNTKVTKTNKLANILELNFNLHQLDNSINLRNGYLSNTLLTYNISDYSDFNHYEPKNPRYKKLKAGMFQSLVLTITDQNNNVVSLSINLVLHVQ